MKNCIVSVVVPVYKVAEFLPRTIDSILAQTYENFELILVDDGSPDNSGQICDNYAAKDNRIRVFHTPNAGAGAAREFGVQQAKGEWIMFVDGDDTITSTALEDLLAIDKEKYDIIAGTINLNDKSIFRHGITGTIDNVRYIIALLQRETSKGPVAKLFRKNLFEEYYISTPKHIKQNEDLLMLLNLSLRARCVYVTNEVLCYNYIYRAESVSKSVTMPLSSWLELFNKIEELIVVVNDDKVRLALFRYKLFMLNVCCIKKGVFIERNKDFVDALEIESKQYNLNINERIMLKRVLSVRFQKCTYKYSLVIANIKKTVKRLLEK